MSVKYPEHDVNQANKLIVYISKMLLGGSEGLGDARLLQPPLSEFLMRPGVDLGGSTLHT